MENDRPTGKRHSLLPLRSSSGVSNGDDGSADGESSGKLELPPPSQIKNRDVSPSKLPVGGGGPAGLIRGSANRQATAAVKSSIKRPLSHHGGSGGGGGSMNNSSLSGIKSGSAQSTGTAAQAASDGSSTAARRLGTTRTTTMTTTTTTPSMSREAPVARVTRSAHKASSSLSDGRSASPVKEGRPLTTRITANVRVQRPTTSSSTASSQQQQPRTPLSPRKVGMMSSSGGAAGAARQASSGPAANKYSLLSGPTTAAASTAQKATLELRQELLHLHALHQHAGETRAQWTASARAHYERRFDRLVAMEDELRTSEMDVLEQRNAAALVAWCREASAATGESKTRVLSGVLEGMWTMVAPGGRYTASVAAFEDWYGIMERGHDLRSFGADAGVVMDGLGDGWKAEVDGLLAALCRMSDALEGLGPAAEPSDLARCLNVLMTMLANMLDELILIRDIEQKLVEREGSWVKGRIEGLGARISGER